MAKSPMKPKTMKAAEKAWEKTAADKKADKAGAKKMMVGGMKRGGKVC